MSLIDPWALRMNIARLYLNVDAVNWLFGRATHKQIVPPSEAMIKIFIRARL